MYSDPVFSRAVALGLLLLAALHLTACDRSIYVRDGVTDGDTFYILPATLKDPDPVNQSWIAYSLSRTSCELGLGGDIPSRNSDYSCELFGRESLLDTWGSFRTLGAEPDTYLDLLSDIRDRGFLDEYIWHFLRRPDWNPPGELEPKRFERWRRESLPGHKPTTRLAGAWIWKNP